jgi:hypothetical protein
MLGLGILAAHLSLGFEVTYFLLHPQFDIWIIISLAIPIGFAAGTQLFWICSLIFGLNLFHCLLHLAGISVLSFILYQKFLKTRPITLHIPSIPRISVFAVSALSLAYILPKFYFPKPSAVPHVCF